MGKKFIIILIMVLALCGVSEAQVTSGTVNSKTLDGIGNKITSTVVGADRGLDIHCLSGCTGAGATQDVNVIELLGVAPGVANPFPQRLSTGVAFYDARDRNWALSSGTDSVTATVSNAFLLDATLTNRFPAGSTSADNESNAVTISRIGNFNYIFDGTAWDRWTGAVSQSGTWNIGTVTTVTTVTNPVTVTGGTVASANNDGTCPSGAASFAVLASNASRTWAAVWASPANTDDVFIKLGATATTSDGRFAPGQALNLTNGRIYTGAIDAIPASGTQAVCAMELN